MHAGAELPGSHMGSAHCCAGGWSDGGELLLSIVLCSIWPESGYPGSGCLGGKQVAKWCVWWEESVGLVCWLWLSMLGLCLSKILAWSLFLGPLCLIFFFNPGSAGKGGDLDRQPQSCSVLDGLLEEQP